MKTSQIVIASLSVIGVASVGYAIYFDYRRRNDIEFRKSLKRASKRTSKVNKKEAEKAAKAEAEAIDRLLKEIRTPNYFPTSVEGREQYFLQHVSVAEQLFTRGPEHRLEASIEFFKALKVYPSPVELIMIYQKAVSKEIFDCIMRIVSKDIALGGVDETNGLAAPVVQDLDEVDEDDPLVAPADGQSASSSAVPAPAAAPAADAPQNGTDSGTTSSQEWDRLSATSLNEPTTSTSASAPAPAPASQSTAEESTLAAESNSTTQAQAPVPVPESSSSSSTDFSSSWSPAPVFGEAKSPSTEASTK